jgi:O-antigen biosynthesis protein
MSNAVLTHGEQLTTPVDVYNLYALFLGRLPESQSLIDYRCGHTLQFSLSEVVGSDEFRANVVGQFVANGGWDDALYPGPVPEGFGEWLVSTFEIPAEDARLVKRMTSWTRVLRYVLHQFPILQHYCPALDPDTRSEFLDALQASSDPAVEDLVDSDVFDHVHYARETGIRFSSRREAAEDYLEAGHRDGANGSPLFEAKFYALRNTDVGQSGVPPLLHYVRHGEAEGRLPKLSRSPRAELPVAPPDDAWAVLREQMQRAGRLQYQPMPGEVEVDVVIPVYRGLNDTLSCIYSVLTARNQTSYELVVIDDASPEPALSAELAKLAELGLITLLVNASNLGFVGTANRGLTLNEGRDVVLLNSDTVVYGDWLDRLRRHALSSAHIATVTPFSNNATIFSYPHFIENNHQALEVGFEELDRIAALVNAGAALPAPTGVGFCFYVTRAALRQIGPFDERLFGKGYGEENDFCMRAREAGFTNLAALDTFVRHTGEVSFGAGADAGKRKGEARLLGAHPRYNRLVSDFVSSDPFRLARTRMDVERFARWSRGRGVLLLTHHWGGGISRHVEDLAGHLAREGRAVLICSSTSQSGVYALKAFGNDDFPNLPKLDWSDESTTVATLRQLRLAFIHIHSLVATSYEDIPGLIDVLKSADLDYYFTAHDYSAICPRLTMMDHSDTYCDTPSERYCEACVERNGSMFGQVDVPLWLANYKGVFDKARRIIAPSRDVARRLREVGRLDYPYVVRSHPLADPKPIKPSAPRSPDPIVVGVIGAIGAHKGFRILRAMCGDALLRGLPIRYVMYGHPERPSDLDLLKNLHATGPYRDKDFHRIFEKQPSDVGLFLSVCPETFCYTLDHAFSVGLLPLAFDLGAIAERIKATGFGLTMPNAYMFDPAGINDLILRLPLGSEISAEGQESRAWTSAAAYYDQVGL